MREARGQGGSNTPEPRRRKRKVFSTKPLKNKIKNKDREASSGSGSGSGSALYPVQFALFPVTCPCHHKGSHWGPYWGHLSLPWPPFLSPQPLKSCTAMCMALMFALYPTCKAIIIHASWQSRALSLLHLQLFALGDDMTARLISSLLHIAPCVSPPLSAFSALGPCTVFESSSRLTTWRVFYLSACVTPLLLWCIWQLSTQLSLQAGKKKRVLMFDTR